MVVKKGRLDNEALHQKIEARAYAIWEQQGRPQGCEVDHWLQAEAEVRALQQSNAKTIAATRSATTARPKRKQ